MSAFHRRTIAIFSILGILASASFAHADKIIMKDGKIYLGHIMGETSKLILISNPPADPQPRFIPMDDILTIVHEGPSAPPSPTRDQLVTLETLITGEFFSPSQMLSPTAALHLAGGLRPFSVIEVGAETNWAPAQSGALAITDGTTTRGYSSFENWNGGFYAKLFPMYRQRDWKWQPYVMTGYLWNRLMPKATTDVLRGYSLEGGAGVSYLLTRNWSVEGRFVFMETRYDAVNFIQREGTLNSDVDVATYTFSTGIAYRFL